MSRKVLQVQVTLDIQAVTCPGVWLCPNGKISLQFSMLDSIIQTSFLQPVFPLLYHEKNVFFKTFFNAHTPGELQEQLNKDFVYAELIQWPTPDVGNVLATFQTSLSDVLYPPSYEGNIAGVDVDLLMEPSKNFPGIIAPKIEISTRTSIEEILCPSQYDERKSSFVIRTVTSDANAADRPRKLHQQKVCHSACYHMAKKCSTQKPPPKKGKPPFMYRKVEEDLISRKVSGLERPMMMQNPWTNGRIASVFTTQGGSQYPVSQKKASKNKKRLASSGKKSLKKKVDEECESGDDDEECSVCSKYESTFHEFGSPTQMGKASPKRKHSEPPMEDVYTSRPPTESSLLRSSEEQSTQTLVEEAPKLPASHGVHPVKASSREDPIRIITNVPRHVHKRNKSDKNVMTDITESSQEASPPDSPRLEDKFSRQRSKSAKGRPTKVDNSSSESLSSEKAKPRPTKGVKKLDVYNLAVDRRSKSAKKPSKPEVKKESKKVQRPCTADVKISAKQFKRDIQSKERSCQWDEYPYKDMRCLYKPKVMSCECCGTKSSSSLKPKSSGSRENRERKPKDDEVKKKPPRSDSQKRRDEPKKPGKTSKAKPPPSPESPGSDSSIAALKEKSTCPGCAVHPKNLFKNLGEFGKSSCHGHCKNCDSCHFSHCGGLIMKQASAMQQMQERLQQMMAEPHEEDGHCPYSARSKKEFNKIIENFYKCIRSSS